jgi:uncharacterized protein YggE
VTVSLALLLASLVLAGDFLSRRTSQSTTSHRTIRVTGEGDVRAAPDMLRLTVRSHATHQSLKVAGQKNDAIVARLVNVGRWFGLDRTWDISSADFAVKTLHATNGDSAGYDVSSSLQFCLRDLARYPAFLRQLAAAGMSQINSFQLTTSDPAKYRDIARTIAINAAQQKATAMAEALELGGGQAVTVIEEKIDLVGSVGRESVRRGDRLAPDVKGLLPANERIRARVTVEFALEPQSPPR